MPSSPNPHSLALTESLRFVPEDFGVLELALHASPELRVATYSLKLARAAGVQYPIVSIDDLVPHIPSGRLVGAGHVVTAESLRIFFPKEFLPIEDEFDLLRKAHITLMRCQAETSRAITIDPAVYEHIMSEAQHPGEQEG
jgi:hypothetical protein